MLDFNNLSIFGTSIVALATLVAPSRVAFFDGARYDTQVANAYCAPTSTAFPAEALGPRTTASDLKARSEAHDQRYVALNLVPLWKVGTVEVRLHSGTTDAAKVLLWVSLWQQLLWAAEHRTDVEVEGASNPALTIAAGNELRFNDGSWLAIGDAAPGKLVVAGTDTAPVVFGAVDTGGPAKAEVDGGAGHGEFGDPCVGNEDCSSGYCIEGKDGFVCTRTCVTECPDGFQCKSISNTFPDVVFICVAQFLHYCQPCKADTQCTQGRCLAFGADGSFCTSACSADSDCPLSFKCANAGASGNSPKSSGPTPATPSTGELRCISRGWRINLRVPNLPEQLAYKPRLARSAISHPT